MSALAADFASAFLRWFHAVAAIAWVGASFYFVWVENALNRGEKQRAPEIAGHLWAVHGGGIYYLEKHKGAPSPFPAPLHWFKWEAYATWFSGMALMVFAYYLNPGARLLAEDSPISGAAAIALSLAFFVFGWIVYAGLCRTALINRPLLLAAAGLGALLIAAQLLFFVFSPRAVFLHSGALIGTVMAGNVLMAIIPAQKQMTEAAKAGREPDYARAKHAGLRSLHNNYLALPAVFLMLSGHYPLFYNHPGAALTLGLMTVCSFFARHFFNCSHRGEASGKWFWLAVAFAILTVVPSLIHSANIIGKGNGDYAAAREIVGKHCAQCHSASPSFPGVAAAPAGLFLESDKQIKTARELILQRTVLSRSMPPGNITKMSEEERALLGAWAAGEKQ